MDPLLSRAKDDRRPSLTDPEPSFDYEAAIWGEETVLPSDRTFAGFRLKTAMECLGNSAKVLDVGCGAGRFLRGLSLARADLALSGVDISQAAIRRAREISPSMDLRLMPDASAPLPAENCEFDAVLALDVLEHLTDPQHMLTEIRRVLVPRGVMHLHVPCEGDVTSLWRWLPGQSGPRSIKNRFGGHVQRFRRPEIMALLRTTGFEVMQTRYSLHVVGNLADVAAFVAIALANLRRGEGAPVTTGTLTARAADRSHGSAKGLFNRLVRIIDLSIWAEARLLARVPSWSLHITARSVNKPSLP